MIRTQEEYNDSVFINCPFDKEYTDKLHDEIPFYDYIGIVSVFTKKKQK